MIIDMTASAMERKPQQQEEVARDHTVLSFDNGGYSISIGGLDFSSDCVITSGTTVFNVPVPFYGLSSVEFTEKSDITFSVKIVDPWTFDFSKVD